MLSKKRKILIELSCDSLRVIKPTWTVITDAGTVLEKNAFDSCSSLPGFNKHEKFIILFPGNVFFYAKIKMPKMRLKNALQALPAMLENQLLGAIENTYFILGKRSGEAYPVIAIDKKIRETFVDALKGMTRIPEYIIPDYLALSLSGGVDWAIKISEGYARVRTGVESGFTVACSYLRLAIEAALRDVVEQKSDTAIISVMHYGDAFDFSILGDETMKRLSISSPAHGAQVGDEHGYAWNLFDEKPPIDLSADILCQRNKPRRVGLWVLGFLLIGSMILGWVRYTGMKPVRCDHPVQECMGLLAKTGEVLAAFPGASMQRFRYADHHLAVVIRTPRNFSWNAFQDRLAIAGRVAVTEPGISHEQTNNTMLQFTRQSLQRAGLSRFIQGMEIWRGADKKQGVHLVLNPVPFDALTEWLEHFGAEHPIRTFVWEACRAAETGTAKVELWMVGCYNPALVAST